MKFSSEPMPGRPGGQINVRVALAIAIAAVLVLGAIFFLFPRPDAVVPIPAPSAPLETVAPAESAQERGDSARDVIAELKKNASGVDYGQAYVRAQEFLAGGDLADAQLLYFFAARGGNGPAAFDLATMYDPNHYSKETSLMGQPDPFQAYKWYRDARAAGVESAVDRLAQLHAWAKKAAEANDADAERLLVQWE